MEAHARPAPLPSAKPDVLKLVYADGVLPVAHAKFRVVALGKLADPKSDLRDDYIAWDAKTSGIGEIWLADPVLIQGTDFLQQVLKRENPNLRVWEYVPPSRPPLTDDPIYRLPRVPMVILIIDEAVGAPALQLPLRPGTVTTTSRRPPIAELNGRAFSDASTFVKQLAQRFDAMDKDRGVISLKLTRCGSPPPAFSLENAWGQLRLQLGTTRSDFELAGLSKKQYTGLRNHVGLEVLSKLLGASVLRSGKVADLYQDQLNQLAALAPSAAAELSHPKLVRLMRGVIEGLGMTPSDRIVKTPMEDVALVGTMLFLVGAISRGYLWGSLDDQFVGSNIELTANVGTSTSCSEDDFESYCELMKP
jgi:hypothetical protein